MAENDYLLSGGLEGIGSTGKKCEVTRRRNGLDTNKPKKGQPDATDGGPTGRELNIGQACFHSEPSNASNQFIPAQLMQVQHFEIIGLDKLLDNSSVESMNEEHTIGDSLDEAEQEELNHEIALESTEDCTGSLCKATAFLFPKTAFDFLTNVAASLFGIHGSPSPSSVLVDPRYEIVKMAEMQPCAEETPKEEQIVKFVAQIDKPILSSEDAVSKRFDVVTDCLDHHFVKENGHESVTRGWLKKVRLEWNILQNDLPGVNHYIPLANIPCHGNHITFNSSMMFICMLCFNYADGIHVRVYEERMDLLRACIVGAPGTPYHDNLFFFDIFFPPDYPHEPPSVHYHSGGLRLNPNLYESGKVCLSLLKTWTGTGNEVWNAESSTVLQLLLSLQALVLNEKPYFNEAGYDKFVGKADGEKNSITYNENAFLLSCKSMMYVLRKPPKVCRHQL
ncbi:putative ubiquitin-conjugating enzyme E2 24 [Zea mays]|uniref:Putative ubiquitin-conjugating enzyme E2 24 n=1 Tax=Zea mays TaxID=4577 RepID=A0A3L6EA68_MAIZE|nr:putative ubiquitin-conjugating enzyme E2 24 [Zea mays]